MAPADFQAKGSWSEQVSRSSGVRESHSGFSNGEAKGSINSCGHLEASEGVFANLRGMGQKSIWNCT